MSDRQESAGTLWADWVTIWQSELAALAADREVQEAVQRGADLWAAQAMALAPGAEPGGDPAGRAGTAAPPGPAAAAAAPGGGEPGPARLEAAGPPRRD